jgi:hypothetical protein
MKSIDEKDFIVHEVPTFYFVLFSNQNQMRFCSSR